MKSYYTQVILYPRKYGTYYQRDLEPQWIKYQIMGKQTHFMLWCWFRLSALVIMKQIFQQLWIWKKNLSALANMKQIFQPLQIWSESFSPCEYEVNLSSRTPGFVHTNAHAQMTSKTHGDWIVQERLCYTHPLQTSSRIPEARWWISCSEWSDQATI